MQIKDDSALQCGFCLREPPAFDRTFALFPYAEPIIQLIVALKFKHDLRIAKTLSELFLRQIPIWYANHPLPDIIIPVPLHSHRLQQRGFNQALEIARPISKALKIPLDIEGIRRAKSTTAQSGLSAALRIVYFKGAFA